MKTLCPIPFSKACVSTIRRFQPVIRKRQLSFGLAESSPIEYIKDKDAYQRHIKTQPKNKTSAVFCQVCRKDGLIRRKINLFSGEHLPDCATVKQPHNFSGKNSGTFQYRQSCFGN
ncbi:hypothetical protein [Neisseria lactamica]|uniref:hypothetical protein n=1 Tax=Neisseria lactamica TaxID=486 RepID=UPI0002DB1B70|nr:hypothetical protein [Neisseria lactamica]